MKLSSRAIVMALLMVGVTISLAIPAVAVDGDYDGFDDAVDDCPYAWGNSTIGYDGCPDADGDGNPDFVGATTQDWRDSNRAAYTWFTNARSRAVVFDPTGNWIVAGGDNGDVTLFSSTGAIKSVLKNVGTEVRDLSFSPNGTYLAVSGYESNGAETVQVLEIDWQTKTATLVVDLASDHEGNVYSVEFSGDGDYLFTGDEDRWVRSYCVCNWSLTHDIRLGDPIYNLDTSPDGRLMGVTHGQELTLLWVSNMTVMMNRHDASGTVSGLDWSPNGTNIVTGSDDNYWRVYDVTNNSSVGNGWENNDVRAISFSPDGGFFAMAGARNDAYMGLASNWSGLYDFADFSSGQGSSRGARDVAWSPDGTRIVFATNRGRLAVYAGDDAYIRLHGEVTSQLMRSRWSSAWPDDGRFLSHDNATASQLTQSLCNGVDIVGVVSHGSPEHLAGRLANHSTTGLRDCANTPRQLLEVPVGRMPAALFVKQTSNAQSCLSTIGGLSMAQLRWIFSSASDASLSQNGWAPGVSLTSVAPNNDGDGVKEWGDLHPSCPQEGIHLTGRWDNRSVPMMMERMLTCSDCEFAEGFFASNNERYRFQLETRSGILFTVSQDDNTLGFTELDVSLAAPGLWLVPIADNWTHGASDHISAGGGMVLPSADNSSNGTWPVQDDVHFIVNEEHMDDRFNLLNWLLTEEGQIEWESMGFVRLGLMARVLSWGRIGVDATNILPDTDGDGIWDGADDCPDTNLGETIDAFGCAQHQIDDDGDGIFNHEDDCVTVAGNSTQPVIGCLDQDGDGWADDSDAFPLVGSQWSDSDSDGYGDNSSGFNADDCPGSFGNSTADRLGCPDTDGDGYSDEDGDWTITDGADVFPLDAAQWVDTDFDGWGDNHSFDLDGDGLRTNTQGDAFPDDVTQWRDIDGDGYGDNPTGDLADDCPNAAGNSTEDSLGCPDRDSDGWSDSADAFPDEVSQWADGDDDGYGDNWNGASPDECIETPYGERNDVNSKGCGPSERDTDTDGIVDSNDFCPNTPIEEAPWVHPDGCAESETDSDGDGVFNPVDGPNGLFKNEPSQSADTDGDGHGDNADGLNGDDCPNRAGDSSKDRDGCPDEDSDGFSDPDSEWTTEDGADAWAGEPTQWSDIDGDGYFDNYGDPTWTPGRDADWPGQYVEGARNPDACPTESSPFADPPGCPPYSGGGNSNIGGDSTSGGGLPFGLIAILVIVVLAIGGLVAAIVVKQKKPKKTRGRLQQALDVVDEAGGEWASEQEGEGVRNAQAAEAGGVDSASGKPPWKLEGEVGDDGFEWLEWPENSGRWWFRNDSGYWGEWSD